MPSVRTTTNLCVVSWETPIDDKNDDSLPLIYAKVMKLVNMVVSKTTDI